MNPLPLDPNTSYLTAYTPEIDIPEWRKGLGAFASETAALGHGLKALGAQVVGATDTRDQALLDYQRNMDASVSGWKAPEVAQIEDIKLEESGGAGRLGSYLGYQVPKGLAQLGSMVVSGLGAGAVARTVASKGIKELAKAEMKNLAADVAKKAVVTPLVEREAGKVAIKQLAERQLLGTQLGVGAGALGMETGQMYGKLATDPTVGPEAAVGPSLAYGGIAAALEYLPLHMAGKAIGLDRFLLRKVIKEDAGLAAKAAELSLKKKALGVVGKVAGGAAAGAATEGITEGLQSLAEQAATKYAQKDPQWASIVPTTPEGWSEFWNSAAAGAAVGGVAGAALGPMTGGKRPVTRGTDEEATETQAGAGVPQVPQQPVGQAPAEAPPPAPGTPSAEVIPDGLSMLGRPEENPAVLDQGAAAAPPTERPTGEPAAGEVQAVAQPDGGWSVVTPDGLVARDKTEQEAVQIRDQEIAKRTQGGQVVKTTTSPQGVPTTIPPVEPSNAQHDTSPATVYENVQRPGKPGGQEVQVPAKEGGERILLGGQEQVKEVIGKADGTPFATKDAATRKLNQLWAQDKMQIQEGPEAGKQARARVAKQGDGYVIERLESRAPSVPDTDSTGKLVHPTPEGRENFKKWFAGSKVVDEEGRPLRVYHGTQRGGFSEFQSGSHFGTQRAANTLLADKADDRSWFQEQPGYDEAAWQRQEVEGRGLDDSIYPVYLQLKNPKQVKDAGTAEGWANEITQAKREGYDGLVYRNDMEGAGTDSYVIFDRDQVKSATSNRGTFEQGNPNILESRTTAAYTAPEDLQGAALWDVWAYDDSILIPKGVKESSTGKPVTVKAYHGSRTGIKEGEFEQRTKAYAGGSFYAAADRETALGYAGRYDGGEDRVYEIDITFDNPLVVDYGGKRYFGSETNRIIELAKERGHDGVIFKNIQDPKLTTTYVVFDKKSLDSPGVMFSQTTAPTQSTTDFVAQTDSVLGQGWTQRAIDAGILVVNETSPAGSASGYFEPSTGKFVVNLDRTPKRQSPVDVLLHEGSHASMARMLGGQFTSFHKDLERLAERGSATAKLAILQAAQGAIENINRQRARTGAEPFPHRIGDETLPVPERAAEIQRVRALIEEQNPGLLAEEDLAYYIQLASSAKPAEVGYWRRLLTAIQAWVAQTNFGKAMATLGWRPELSPQLAVELAKQAAQATLRRAELVNTLLGERAKVLRSLPAAAQLGVMEANVWHAGPTTWAPEPGYPRGRPRLDKVGTGEGGQMYGWGWYSAENEGVSGPEGQYAKAFATTKQGDSNTGWEIKDKQGNTPDNRSYFSAKDLAFLDQTRETPLPFGQPSKYSSVLDNTVYTAESAITLAKGNFAKAIRELESRVGTGHPHYTETIPFAIKLLNQWKANGVKATAPPVVPAFVARLSIPDADIQRMIQWEKPLSEQTEEVKAALSNIDFQRRDWKVYQDASNIIDSWADKNNSFETLYEKSALKKALYVWHTASTDTSLKDLFGKLNLRIGARKAADDVLKLVAIPNDKLTGKAIYDNLEATLPKVAGEHPKKKVSEYLRGLGIVGNKYLDYGSRRPQFDPDLDIREYGGGYMLTAKHNNDTIFSTKAEAVAALERMYPGTYNYVIWDQDVLNRVGTQHLDWQTGEVLESRPSTISPSWWRSGVATAVASAPQQKAAPQQWVGWLTQKDKEGNLQAKQPGTTIEEMEDLGLIDWLLAQEGSVQKADVEKFVRDGGVRIEEVLKYEKHLLEWTAVDNGDGRWFVQDENGFQVGTAYDVDTEEAAIRQLTNNALVGGPKFAIYQVPGGENYRELLITVPVGKETKTIMARQILGPDIPTEVTEDKPSYRSSHWSEPNVLVHIRFNERTGADGKRVLFVEEVQSDWHQEGRKRGYRGAEDVPKEALILLPTDSSEVTPRPSFVARYS